MVGIVFGYERIFKATIKGGVILWAAAISVEYRDEILVI